MNKKVAFFLIGLLSISLCVLIVGIGITLANSDKQYQNDTIIEESINMSQNEAIVDGEAFAADPVEEDTRTPEESAYDLGKEMGLTDEEIAEALGQPIPDSRVDNNTNDNSVDNNTIEQLTPENNQSNMTENNQSENNSNTGTSNPDENLTSGLNGKDDTQESELNVWTPPEGFVDPLADVEAPNVVEGTGETGKGLNDDNIKWQ